MTNMKYVSLVPVVCVPGTRIYVSTHEIEGLDGFAFHFYFFFTKENIKQHFF